MRSVSGMICVMPVLNPVLEPGMEVAICGITSLTVSALELHHEAKHAVRRGVLRADVDTVFGAEVVIHRLARTTLHTKGHLADVAGAVDAGVLSCISTDRLNTTPRYALASRSCMSRGRSP